MKSLRSHVISVEIDDIPTRVRLFSPGENRTTKGSVWYDPGLSSLVAKNQRINDTRDRLPIDIAHLSLTNAPTVEAHASYGWFKVNATRDGIWAEDIQWTEEGLALLSTRKFRFISPAFYTQVHSDRDTIVQVENFALTNNPASLAILPLVASQEFTGEDDMKVKNQESATPSSAETSTRETIPEILEHKTLEDDEPGDEETPEETPEDTSVVGSIADLPHEELVKLVDKLMLENEELLTRIAELTAELADAQAALSEIESEREAEAERLERDSTITRLTKLDVITPKTQSFWLEAPLSVLRTLSEKFPESAGVEDARSCRNAPTDITERRAQLLSKSAPTPAPVVEQDDTLVSPMFKSAGTYGDLKRRAEQMKRLARS